MDFDLENPLSTFSDSISSLFHVESDHMPSQNYSQSLLKSTDFDLSVRSQAVSLILHFSCNFDPFLSYLAINYLDRFLSTQCVSLGKPWVVRLLAVSCVSLGLKMRETQCSVTDIQHDGGFIFDTQTIQRMEMLILGALQWRMRSVTPSLSSISSFLCSNSKTHHIMMLEFRPSIIAASALLSASHELFPLQCPSFRVAISNCSYVNKDELFNCCNLMQDIAMDGYESVLELASSSRTPANVLDRHFSSSSSNSDSEKTNTTAEAITTTTTTARLVRDTKRQKISSFKNDNSFQLSAFPDSTVLS
ncbi:putative cyclin-D6-1 [Camellia lanceoleosa]|uniref:Cyclin-D6-1 n=1 Tax=Camellia lanceoleosa TaxID=1840588 RepID=A0ACC0GXN9_9ERIC|nr:putative cyclin-D6-1 [Camellia lanceoleosa]